jgi:hypothetical protein
MREGRISRSIGPEESFLSLQARKSDIDAFAKGTTDLDAFRKKVTILTY